MLKKALFLTALLSFSCLVGRAVPAYPAKRVVTLADGRQVTLTLRGDEHYSFYVDEQNQPYRQVDADRFQPVSAVVVEAEWRARLQKANQRHTRRAGTRAVGEPSPSLTGEKKGLVILMEFQDKKFSIENPQATYQDFFNKQGYTDFGMAGSVRDYFKAQSYGLLDIEFDVAGPYTTAQKMAYYGAPSGGDNDTCPWEMVREACRAANADVDYTDYDWDGDGEVDQVFVIYAGYGQNYGADENTIWPHEFKMSYNYPDLTLDGVTIDTYACSCELSGTSGTNLDGIGAACHEFSHCLGLPDFYDTSATGSNFGMGAWDVMDSGSYNDNSRTPAGYSSYERMFAGWLTPTELSTMTRVSDLKPLADTPEAYILYNDANHDEYYLLENRQKKGFDAGLPGHGMLVLHVTHDEKAWMANEVNQGSIQHMTIIPADNAANRSSYSSDPFPGSRNVTELTNYSTPAASLYYENEDGQKLMSKPLDHITESEDGLIAFVACRPEMEIPAFSDEVKAEGNSFTVSWEAVADAIEYELELTETPASKHDLEECLLVEEPFDKCYSKSTGFSDISSKISNYFDTGGWTGSKLFTSPNGLLLGTSQATGYVVGPTFDTPASGEITVVIGGEPYGQATSAKGSLRFITTESDDLIPFELTAGKRIVFHLETRYPRFRVGVFPESRMYLNYYAVYEGVFTEEELNATEQAQARPRRISAVTYTTDQTNYTFTDLNTTSRYNYRIRAIGEETVSQWGEEHEFHFDSTVGIGAVEVLGSGATGRVYDLQGRQVDPASLRKGVYIVDGKKVVR